MKKRGLIKSNPVFNESLKDLEKRDKTPVPLFMTKAITAIEKSEKGKGMITVGIYRYLSSQVRLRFDSLIFVSRLSGNMMKIEEIKNCVDAGDLDYLAQVQDVHNLTGAFKLFFRELKDPLLPWGTALSLITFEKEKNKSKRIKSIQSELSKIPTAHRETLKVLLLHLQNVQEFNDKNKMDAKNLATIFGPCLTWRPIVDHDELVNDLTNQKSLAEMLISHCKSIYEN